MTGDHKRAGRCTVHDDLAWLWNDGSIGCMGALVIEIGTDRCQWEPMPTRWAKGLGVRPQGAATK